MSDSIDIRIKRGKKISTLAEIRGYQESLVGEKLLFGSASNYEVIKNDSVLYSEDDFYGREQFYVPYEGMAAVNLGLGAMGRGKTTMMNNIINGRPDSNMVIHDPKGEYNLAFYNPEKGDMIVAYLDRDSVVWDVFAEIALDRQIGELIFRNMLLSVRGEGNKDGEEWVTYAVGWLMRLAAHIIDERIELGDICVEIVRIYKEFKLEVGVRDDMSKDELGTAGPIFNLLFQMYYVGAKDGRRFVTVQDMTQARRVFLCNSRKSPAQLNIVNNALLACLVNAYLSRPNVSRKDISKYSYFILDEFLTFKLDKESESALLTLCRSKGVSVWLGMQRLPAEKERLSQLTASRYITAVFKLDDAYTQEEIEKLSGDIHYQRKECLGSMADSGGMMSLGGGPSLTETLVDVPTKQIPRELLGEMTQYVAYLEVNDLSGRYRTFMRPTYLETLKNPTRISSETEEEGFLYSDVARFAPRIEEVAE